MNQSDELRPLLEAASFSTRAHKNQFRKDKITPYTAHTFRVFIILRHVFGVDHPIALQSALLHDTIEDTDTDYDDIQESFGTKVADCVAALTKDMRLPEPEREKEYIRCLSGSNSLVRWCKLADIYDNLIDSSALTPKAQQTTISRVRAYLDAIAENCPAEVKPALDLVEILWKEFSKS